MHLQMTARGFSYAYDTLLHTLPYILYKKNIKPLDNQKNFAPPHFRQRTSWYLMIMPTGTDEESLAITSVIHLD